MTWPCALLAFPPMLFGYDILFAPASLILMLLTICEMETSSK